ncbi:tyrosine-type recombinase/integrase [Neobacillus drentensis]|uniref:tyrosine-type recombinase/integrase n=1 Tax=Neobacillus drentensis TaxID=220684 RepID=UPI002FFF5D5E
MALKKKARRKQVGEISNRKEYPKLTLNQAIDYVISGKRAEGLRDRTLRDYTNMWRYFTDWLAENYEVETIDELTTDVFRNYINYLRYDAKRYDGHKYIDAEKQGVGLKEASINIRIRTYRAIFNHLDREGLIEYNPMNNVKELRTDIDLTNCFTDEDVKALLAQPNQRTYVGFRDYVAMIVLLDTGMRMNEIINLRVSEIDFQTRFITLEGDRNKNRKPRLIPFSAQVAKILLQLIAENREHFKTDRLFLSTYGENLGWNQLNKRLKYHAEKAGIDGKKVTSHVYRHTWAKNMILNGCDPFTLQKMGGWQDIRTMRRYIQMDTTEMRRSHDDFSPISKFRK